MVSRGMDSLSETERLALQLRFERGLTAQEIGTYLDLPPRAVYQRLDRTLKRLRRRLEGSGVRGTQVRRVLASSWKELSFLGRLSAELAPTDV